MVVCCAGDDGKLHGFASERAALPFCKSAVKRDPSRNSKMHSKQACEGCLPEIAARLKTSAANVLAMMDLKNGGGVALPGDPS